MLFNRKMALAALLAPALVAGTAYGAEPGFYIGASGGQTTMKAEGDVPLAPGVIAAFDLDENETGWKAFAGYNFLPWLGVEAGYVSLGETSKDRTVAIPGGGTSLIQSEIKASGAEGFVVGTLPLGNFDVFGKIGAIAAEIDLDVDRTTTGVPGTIVLPLSLSDSESNGMMAYGGGVAYNFGNWAIRAEYEAYDTDKLDDLYFVSAGLVYTFGRHEEPKAVPVAAPAPAPRPVAAAAPAKCPDADKDGVCDSVDHCPATPAGARVGPGGCDCDYVLELEFPFDSAQLHADDIAKLDAIVPVLKNAKVAFIGGEVNGYTDSTGDEAYNVGLSKRRAEAVAKYMQSKGVNLSDRFITNGYGEAHPVASNDTKEGRAKNRRVVLRRTDCGAAH